MSDSAKIKILGYSHNKSITFVKTSIVIAAKASGRLMNGPHGSIDPGRGDGDRFGREGVSSTMSHCPRGEQEISCVDGLASWVILKVPS